MLPALMVNGNGVPGTTLPVLPTDVCTAWLLLYLNSSEGMKNDKKLLYF